MPVIDFSQAKTLKAIPEGWHNAVVLKAEEAVSKAGNKMIQVTWELTGHNDPEFVGRKVPFDNVMLETDAIWRTILVFQALGLIDADLDPNDQEAVQALGKLEFEVEDLIGLEADIKTVNEEYEGRTNPKVKGIRVPKATLASALS